MSHKLSVPSKHVEAGPPLAAWLRDAKPFTPEHWICASRDDAKLFCQTAGVTARRLGLHLHQNVFPFVYKDEAAFLVELHIEERT